MNLSLQEKKFLRAILKEHLAYYEALVRHPQCSAKSRQAHAFLAALMEKL